MSDKLESMMDWAGLLAHRVYQAREQVSKAKAVDNRIVEDLEDLLFDIDVNMRQMCKHAHKLALRAERLLAKEAVEAKGE